MWAAELQNEFGQQPCVLVTVASIAGSAPRALGSRMLVTMDGFSGSIGGGNLEFRAIASARKLLTTASANDQSNELFGLGPELNQCCGGAVTLLYETYRDACPAWLEELTASATLEESVRLVSAIDTPRVEKWLVRQGDSGSATFPPALDRALQSVSWTADSGSQVIETDAGRFLVETVSPGRKPLALFGAGHVGTALAEAIRPLPFDVTWLDSRPGQFELAERDHLRMIQSPDPAGQVNGFPPGTTYVVMTHSHELDEDICYRVLQREDAAWLGLIGSATKRRRFVHRLEKRGIPAAALESLICPVGLPGITGKRPATIAVAVAAQLLREVVPAAWR